jgi:hypothetical protein
MPMNTLNEYNTFTTQFQVNENETETVVSVHCQFTVPNASNNPDQIENYSENIGQQFKRNTCQFLPEESDKRNTQLAQHANPSLLKNGTAEFKFKTVFGIVKMKRQRLRNKKTGQSLTPSAMLWNTSHHSHLTAGLKELCCTTSQELSYRKSAGQIKEKSGDKQLLSTTSVWNMKQHEGQKLSEKQSLWFDNPDAVTMADSVQTSEKRIPKGTIELQIDEVETKSQEQDKKVNLTYTAIIETDSGKCFYLAAASSLQLFWIIWCHLIRLGIYDGQSLSVISDGARWISKGIREIFGVEVVHLLCWYHLRKRIDEGISGVGLGKKECLETIKLLLRYFWYGQSALAVWELWGQNIRNGLMV